jgi:soluble lytic murein transglycosylase
MGNEFMQRRFEGYLNSEMIDLVFPDRFQKEIHAEAARNKTDPILITSLIKQESGFKPIAISSSGALGLMQLMPFTAIDVKKDLALSTLRDPSVNIAVGTRYLQSLLDKYGGNVPFALAAYNAGPHRVMKWRKEIRPDWTMIQFIESIPYRETREYVSSILRNRYWYRIRQGIAEGRLLDALGTP